MIKVFAIFFLMFYLYVFAWKPCTGNVLDKKTIMLSNIVLIKRQQVELNMQHFLFASIETLSQRTMHVCSK